MRFGNRRSFDGGEDVKPGVISYQICVFSPLITENTPQLPLCNNYWQPEIGWVPIILCAFCQKNFFFAIKLHKKKIIVVGEIDSFTCLNEDYLLGVARVSTVAAQKSIEYPTMKFSKIAVTIVTSLLNKNLSQLILKNL